MEAQASKYEEVDKFDWCMQYAIDASRLSTDYRRQIGVAIFNDGLLIATGSNQATIKWHPINKLHKRWCIRKMLGIKKHAYYWICPGCATFKNHAEARAIREIYSMRGFKRNITMYLYGHDHCCNTCLEKVNKLGINKIYISK